ncbi:MAG: hypothetical protein PHN80_04955 [Hespellia sp.]|nr:hypothetical protein [Hespellia sp.]
MSEQVWNKVKQFFEELRCEDQSRTRICMTQERQTAVSDREQKRLNYEKAMESIEKNRQDMIEQFVDAVEHCASEECQQSYFQGYMDCIQVLTGLGILKPEKNLLKLIEEIK